MLSKGLYKIIHSSVPFLQLSSLSRTPYFGMNSMLGLSEKFCGLVLKLQGTQLALPVSLVGLGSFLCRDAISLNEFADCL